jgi:CheY-like chemotaxis protein
MIAPAAPPMQPTPPSVAARQVLVVEDDYLIALLIAEQLAELGCAVVGPAHSIAEGRWLAASAPIDCALLDWELAGAASNEVADILARRQIPFLFVTGHATLPDARYGAVPILCKPFGLPDLQRAMDEATTSGRAAALTV